MSTFVIEKGIPLPPPSVRGTSRSVYRELVSKMQVGDSVMVDKPQQATVILSAAKKLGFKASSRTDKVTKAVRVWRVA